MKALIKYLTFVLTLSLLVGCSQEFAPNPGSLLDTDQSPFALKEDEGGDEGAGNNLSFPVIWADGSLSLRHDMTEQPMLKGEFYDRKNALLKTLTQYDYKEYLPGIFRADRFEMVNHQTGKSTTLLWSNYQFKTGLSDRDFDKNSLKRAR